MKAYVIYDAPEHDVNLYHWGHCSAPDSFFALKYNNKTAAFVSDLEFGRFKSSSTFDEVLLWEEIRAQLPKKKTSFWCAFFQFLQKKYRPEGFVLPNSFPASIYAEIVSVVPVAFDTVYFQTQRAIKQPTEVQQIRQACALTANTIAYAKQVLTDSQVGKSDKLYYKEAILSSERLRTLMEIHCMQQGGYASETITAGGTQASLPHCTGYGPLYAHQLIVIDFFPRLQTTHYYGDMTRTVLKGTASEQQRRLFQCVLDCQQAVLERIKPGVLTSALMSFTVEFFEQQGYGRRISMHGMEGFIHSLGHGLGLDLHEYPSVSTKPISLEPGMVITVEPGLYFHDLGGVRMEDVVCVTDQGCEVLSSLETTLEIAI